MDSSKSPFDDPEFPGKSESATGDPSSATAIFGTVSAKPSSQQDDDLLKSLMGAQSRSSFRRRSAKPDLSGAVPDAAIDSGGHAHTCNPGSAHTCNTGRAFEWARGIYGDLPGITEPGSRIATDALRLRPSRLILLPTSLPKLRPT